MFLLITRAQGGNRKQHNRNDEKLVDLHIASAKRKKKSLTAKTRTPRAGGYRFTLQPRCVRDYCFGFASRPGVLGVMSFAGMAPFSFSCCAEFTYTWGFCVSSARTLG